MPTGTGNGPGPPDLTVTPPSPSQSLTYAKALEGNARGTSNLLKFAEIVAQQRVERNVLEVKIKRNQTKNESDEAFNAPRGLNMDDISEIVFEILGINFEDCIGVDYFTGRYDTKEILLKPGVDATKYITMEPIMYKDHEIQVKKMLNDLTKVTFKNVPMYVPDEEILHLCGVYGTVPDNKVHWETIRVSTANKKGVLVSPTRYVLMNINNGAMFNNFYWLEGPMAGDPGRRVTVLHPGQRQQCSNCFLTTTTGCKGAGNGRACFRITGSRVKMSTYMETLKSSTGYESLKAKYMRQLARTYPKLQGEPGVLDSTQVGDMDAYSLDDEEFDNVVNIGIIPINPIVEKDQQIEDLTKTIESLKEKIKDIPKLEKSLEEAKTENRRALSLTRQAGRRLSVSRKANEQKMVGLIKSGTNWSEDSAHLACSHAAALNDEEFIIDTSTDTVIPKDKNFNFLKKVEEYLEKTDQSQMERLSEMRRLILDQMKPTIKRRGEKRVSDSKDENPQAKQRVNSPPKSQI